MVSKARVKLFASTHRGAEDIIARTVAIEIEVPHVPWPQKPASRNEQNLMNECSKVREATVFFSRRARNETGTSARNLKHKLHKQHVLSSGKRQNVPASVWGGPKLRGRVPALAS